MGLAVGMCLGDLLQPQTGQDGMGLGYGALSAAKTVAGAKLDQQFSKKGEQLFGGGTSLPYDFTIRSLGTTYERETEQQAYHQKQAAESRSRYGIRRHFLALEERSCGARGLPAAHLLEAAPWTTDDTPCERRRMPLAPRL